MLCPCNKITGGLRGMHGKISMHCYAWSLGTRLVRNGEGGRRCRVSYLTPRKCRKHHSVPMSARICKKKQWEATLGEEKGGGTGMDATHLNIPLSPSAFRTTYIREEQTLKTNMSCFSVLMVFTWLGSVNIYGSTNFH